MANNAHHNVFSTYFITQPKHEKWGSKLKQLLIKYPLEEESMDITVFMKFIA
jgi:hypothetical protein